MGQEQGSTQAQGGSVGNDRSLRLQQWLFGLHRYLLSALACCAAPSGGLMALRALPQPQHPSRLLPLLAPGGGVCGGALGACPDAAAASPQCTPLLHAGTAEPGEPAARHAGQLP